MPRRGGVDSFKFGPEHRSHGRGGPAKDVVGGKGMNVHAPGRSVEQEKISKSPLPYRGTVTEKKRQQKEVWKAENRGVIMKRIRRPTLESTFRESVLI